MHQAQQHQQHLTLALLGKTGHGKSATGNTILGNSVDYFESINSLTSLTMIVKRNGHLIRDINGHSTRLTVYDTPGSAEADADERDKNRSKNDKKCKQLKRTIQYIKDVLRDSFVKRTGVDAFVFVFSVTMKFTQEEKDVIDEYRKVLGDNVFSERGIVVFTHGDNFKSTEETPDFRAWCDQQTGPMRDLFEECRPRIFLVYNLTEDTERRQRSADEIIRYASEIKGNQIPYTWAQFEAASETRKDICLKYKSASLTLEFVNEIASLTNELTDMLTNVTHERRNNFIVKIKMLKERIEKKSQGRDFFQQQLTSLNQLERSVPNVAPKSRCILS